MQAVVPTEFQVDVADVVFLAPREADGDKILVEVAPLRQRRHCIANRALASMTKQLWFYVVKVAFFTVYSVCDSIG